MNERRQRLLLWTGVCALLLSLSIPKGHEVSPDVGASVAFLHASEGMVTVRVDGDIPHPGVHNVGAHTTVGDLVRKVVPDRDLHAAEGHLHAAPLADGDVITVVRGEGTMTVLARQSMPAGERMVLGVPLDLQRMTPADWEALPGIGPALATRISHFGRERGGIRSLDDLRGVSGIGEGTIERVRPYFRTDRQ